MTKPTTAKDRIKIVDDLELSLKDIFPSQEIHGEEADDTHKVNQAYKKLFEELIPGFGPSGKHVQFVLAEVLEIDRKKSGSRLLVYSDLGDEDRKSLIKEYKEILNSLIDVSPVLISESNAFYLTSRIWCAETEGISPPVDSKAERSWTFLEASITKTGTDVSVTPDLEDETQSIERIFVVYVQKLYERYLKNYPHAYVLLVPIVLNSISPRKESLQKLGAVFLHFATTKRVELLDLRRIYARTLLFWHYYFTSEAIETRQEMIRENQARLQENRARADLYERIEPYLREIQKGFRDIRQPLRQLETELNPIEGLFNSDDASEFFSVNGRSVRLHKELAEISPRHDWIDGDLESFKRIVAGVLTRVLSLEQRIPKGDDLWHSVTTYLRCSTEPLHEHLLRSLPALNTSSPDTKEVRAAFDLVKSWFSDSFKVGNSPGLPFSMLESALQFWGANTRIENADGMSHFWVASRSPVVTVTALGIINSKYGIKEAHLRLKKERDNGSRLPISECELRLDLSLSEARGSLTKLSRSFAEARKTKEKPRGDMTTFLWDIADVDKLTLSGTRFRGARKDGEVTIDFKHRRGTSKELLLTWKGRMYV